MLWAILTLEVLKHFRNLTVFIRLLAMSDSIFSILQVFIIVLLQLILI